MWRFGVILGLVLGIAACGQSGALYLPPAQTEAPKPTEKPAELPSKAEEKPSEK